MMKNGRRGRYLWLLVMTGVIFVLVTGASLFKVWQKQQEMKRLNSELVQKTGKDEELINGMRIEIERLNNEDLRKTNNGIKKEMEDLKISFKSVLGTYEEILKLRERGSTTIIWEGKFASVLDFLAKDDLSSAQKLIDELKADIDKEKTRLATLGPAAISANVLEAAEAPTSGYRKQKVMVGDSAFLVDIVAADLSSTKVIVDTASDGTCTKDCPVLPLATYVSRSGAYAGINGTYFCPETYPSCADKKNTFDVLVMNKNKVYFNSENNVYSTVPVAVFSGSSARFIGQTLEWGRDTGVDAVIANRPLLMLDGNLMFGGGGEEKETIRSNRSFLGASGGKVYMGVVRNATVAESARVLQTMGVKSAINLDSGGSTALWSGGYKVGPGRNLPNVVLFVKK